MIVFIITYLKSNGKVLFFLRGFKHRMIFTAGLGSRQVVIRTELASTML